MKRSRRPPGGPAHGRGTGVPDPVDVYVGSRIRQRRLLIGMNQETLAKELGLTFQQVQKYEGGANRVSASRLAEIAEVLGVGIEYFYAGLPSPEDAATPEAQARQELLQRPETLELVKAYYAIADQNVRRQFFELVSAVAQSSDTSE